MFSELEIAIKLSNLKKLSLITKPWLPNFLVSSFLINVKFWIKIKVLSKSFAIIKDTDVNTVNAY